MLPAAARVRTRSDHKLVAQIGCRVRRGSVVVSMAVAPSVSGAADGGRPGQARGAVIAGRRVGPAVTRNRVKRRLRELLREQLTGLPGGSLVVIRALPGAQDASYAQLGGWVEAGLRHCVARSRADHVDG